MTPEVERFAQLHGDPVDEDRAATTIELVTAMAKSYTRGQGFTDGAPAPDIAAVIAVASARLYAHPDQIGMRETLGSIEVEYRQGFQGFSILERIVLDRYRVKAK